MLESRAERSALGASLRGARHSSSRRWRGFSESPNLAADHTSKQTDDPSTISASTFAEEACFDFARMIRTSKYIFLRPNQNLKLGIGFASESALTPAT